MCAKCLKEGQMLDFTMPKKKKKSVVSKTINKDSTDQNNKVISNVNDETKNETEEQIK
jgi:hypothetical protein